MKNIIFILALIFSISAISQNLTFSELNGLQNTSFKIATEYLYSKNWILERVDRSSNEHYSMFFFIYQEGSNATAAIVYYVFDEEPLNKLMIVTESKKAFDRYHDIVKSSSATLVKSNVENGEVSKDYEYKDSHFSFVESLKREKPKHSILIESK